MFVKVQIEVTLFLNSVTPVPLMRKMVTTFRALRF
jgi:hypothetical protein